MAPVLRLMPECVAIMWAIPEVVYAAVDYWNYLYVKLKFSWRRRCLTRVKVLSLASSSSGLCDVVYRHKAIGEVAGDGEDAGDNTSDDNSWNSENVCEIFCFPF